MAPGPNLGNLGSPRARPEGRAYLSGDTKVGTYRGVWGGGLGRHYWGPVARGALCPAPPVKGPRPEIPREGMPINSPPTP